MSDQIIFALIKSIRELAEAVKALAERGEQNGD